VRRAQTSIAAVQHANHEVGTIQPVAEAAVLAREAAVRLHVDARQTAGRLPIDVDALGVDLLSTSARTFGGPPGAGALYIRRGVRITPLLFGDDREERRRAGMQNIPSIAAMAAALTASLEDSADRTALDWSLTTRLRRALETVDGIRVHGHPTQRTPHLVCFSAPNADAEKLLTALDDRGFRLDAGSVATGNPREPSPVLAAMGVPDTVGFRASVGPGIEEADVDALVEAVAGLVAAS
jgi:cysteine desulfurase